MLTPKAQARQTIDRMLTSAGWCLQDMNTLNISAGTGVTGPESKMEGAILTLVEEQSSRYVTSRLKWQKSGEPLRFLYETTDIETQFTDNSDPTPRTREYSPSIVLKPCASV